MKIIRKMLSILLIMLMIIPCTLLAYAEDAVPEAADTVAEQTETPQAEPTQAEPEAEASAEDLQDAPEAEAPEEAAPAEVPAEPEAEAAPEDPDTEAAAPEPEPEETPAEAGNISVHPAKNAAPKDKNITVAGTSLDCTSDGSGTGWNYDKESGTILLRDFVDNADITSDGTGITIVTSGLNRIGSLSCDGNVDIIGSGIILIDSIELAEGCDLNLLPVKDMYGEDGGSAAVFLLQEDGTYKLINKYVTGIIDEKIDLLDGTTLVLPENTSVELKALVRKTSHDENGDPVVTYHFDETPSIEAGDQLVYYGGDLDVSSLILETGASIVNNVLGDDVIAKILVENSLTNNGTISGGKITLQGDYSGSGVISDAMITVDKGQEMSISIKDSDLNLYGSYTLTELTAGGSSAVYYDTDTTINNIKMSSGDSLKIYSKRDIDSMSVLKLTDSVTGGIVFLGSGLAEVSDGFRFLDGGVIQYRETIEEKLITSGAVLVNYSAMSIFSNGIDGPAFMGAADVTMPAQTSIPVVSFVLTSVSRIKGYYDILENVRTEHKYEVQTPYDATKANTAGVLTFEELKASYCPDETLYPAGCASVIFEVFSLKDGKISMDLVTKSASPSASSEGVFLIRAAYLIYSSEPAGGTAVTSTLADRTGAGTIGGNSNSVLKGTGLSRNKPEEEKTDTPKPINTGKKTSAKTVRSTPAKSAPIAVNTAVRNYLALQINEYDLNFGTAKKDKATYYILSAYLNGGMVTELDRPVDVMMDYELSEEYKNVPLYAVFANEDENSDELLSAVRARYDEDTLTINFETSQLGDFVIAPLDFKGREFSPQFYDELEKVKEVQPLIELLKEKEENADL